MKVRRPTRAFNFSRKTVRRLLAAACFTGIAIAARAQPGLVTFDDLHTADYATNGMGQVSPTPLNPLPPVQLTNGYVGLGWNNLYAIDGPLVGDTIDNNAPHKSTKSEYNIALSYVSVADITSGSAFNLESGFFNSLCAFNLNLEIQGYNGATLLYDQFFTLAPADQSVLTAYYTNGDNLCFAPEPLSLALGMDGITDARFIVSGGQALRFNASGGMFAMDDLVITPAPEPSTLALAGVGIAGLLALRRGRRSLPFSFARQVFCCYSARLKNVRADQSSANSRAA